MFDGGRGVNEGVAGGQSKSRDLFACSLYFCFLSSARLECVSGSSSEGESAGWRWFQLARKRCWVFAGGRLPPVPQLVPLVGVGGGQMAASAEW